MHLVCLDQRCLLAFLALLLREGTRLDHGALIQGFVVDHVEGLRLFLLLSSSSLSSPARHAAFALVLELQAARLLLPMVVNHRETLIAGELPLLRPVLCQGAIHAKSLSLSGTGCRPRHEEAICSAVSATSDSLEPPVPLGVGLLPGHAALIRKICRERHIPQDSQVEDDRDQPIDVEPIGPGPRLGCVDHRSHFLFWGEDIYPENVDHVRDNLNA